MSQRVLSTWKYYEGKRIITTWMWLSGRSVWYRSSYIKS